MYFKGKLYDVLKFIALIFLPAFGVFYVGLGQIWGFPEIDKVATSIVVVQTFLGTLLQISSSQYRNSVKAISGYLTANGEDPDTGIPNLQLTVTKHPTEILEGKTAMLKIGSPPPRVQVPSDPNQPQDY